MFKLGITAREEINKEPFGKQTFFFEDMINEGNELEIDVFFFSPMKWSSESDLVEGYIFEDNKWIKTKREIPKILYNRFTPKSSEEENNYSIFKEFAAKDHIKFTTPFDLVELVKNKVSFHSYLLENKISTIEPHLINDITDDLLRKLLHYDSVIYIKPIHGSNGKGISILKKVDDKYYIKGENDSNILMSLEESVHFIKANFSDDYFIQSRAKIIDFDEKPYDIRVLVQNHGNNNYKITGSGVRVGESSSWVSNLSFGGKALPLYFLKDYIEKEGLIFSETIEEINALCLKCTHLLDKKFGSFAEIAFDILLTKDKGALLLEGNSKPARWIFNLICDNFEHSSEQFQKYQTIRKLSVKMPLVFAKDNFG